MKINFNVKYCSGLVGSLNIQIIPSSLSKNESCLDSIVIDEIAFSLVEKFFLNNEEAYAHWGNTYIGFEKIQLIIDDLYTFYLRLKETKDIHNEDIKLIFKEETEFFLSSFLMIKYDVLKMVEDIIHFLESVVKEKKDGITIIGI